MQSKEGVVTILMGINYESSGLKVIVLLDPTVDYNNRQVKRIEISSPRKEQNIELLLQVP